MERILNEQYIRSASTKVAQNLTMPMTDAAQDSFSLYLLVTGREEPHSLVLLVERNLVFSLFSRPSTVNVMSVRNLFDPQNAPKAIETGEFVIGNELSKTTYVTGSSQHQGIGTHNHIVYPNFKRPWICPIFTIVVSIVEKEERNPGRDNLSLEDRFLDSLSITMRPKKPYYKVSGSQQVRHIADSAKINNKLRDKFRKGKEK